ncbi:hypothetical protein MHYP_G00250130 [Metynnis hypsauchen]
MWLRLHQRNADNVDRNFPLTWTNQISTQTSASKTLTIIRPPAPISEMERSRAVLLTLVCVFFSRISGAEVEMRVRPGDDVTLYSDCLWKSGFKPVWFRKSSHEHEPPFMISAEDMMRKAHPRYSFVWNPSIQTFDLLVKKVTGSDLGLYFCAVHEKNITKNQVGVRYEDVYHHGTRAIRLSFLPLSSIPCADLPQTTPTSTAPDCSTCWKLLMDGDEVCYASLDLPSRGQKRLKKKRVESSDFSTYSEVKTDKM